MNRDVIKSRVTPYRIGFGSSTTGDTLEYRLLGVTAGAIVEIVGYISTGTFELGDGEYGVDFAISNTSVKFVQFRLQTAGYVAAVSVDVREDDNALLLRLLGLSHENINIDQTVYDSYGNLQSARQRIYSESGSVGTDNDVLATYQITAVGTAANRFSSWKQERQ